jgi:uncharacterized protein DUF5916/cellulose/xylan binding protein with CBM9 domain
MRFDGAPFRPGGTVRALIPLAMLLLVAPAAAQSPDTTRHAPVRTPVIQAARLSGAVRVDGRLTETAWEAATPATQFTQLDPREGEPASERTEVRVLIGDDALYVGARMFDADPGRIRARLARRDDPADADEFNLYLDSYHDQLTGTHFRITPAGALYDAAIAASGEENTSWDPVWEAAAHVDSLGWTAELRIPLSQLRYAARGDGVWGINFARVIHRRGENDWWSFTPKHDQAGPARYGHLAGLGSLPMPRRLELLPYSLARNERLDIDRSNPFRTRNDWFGATGGDLKYGITSSLTLDATVNPDFGQVELDPAEVNLTTSETFFTEKRPFFVEGAGLFGFGQSRAFNNFGAPRILYTRRIGRAPQIGLGGPDVKVVDAPVQTTIGAAAKLTGRTQSGWSVGAIDAVTTREQARWLDQLDVRHENTVEPLTQYFAGRLKRDLRHGNTVLGGMLTAADRRLDDPLLTARLRREAYVAGADLAHAWADRHWALDAALSGTLVRGSATSIAATQRSPLRYYQRPDHADYAVYDPTRTALSGYGLDASVTRLAGTHWLGSLAYVSRSPGYELNDVGYQTRADYRGVSSALWYQETKPGKLFRNYNLFPYANQVWNFGGDLVFNAVAFNASAQLLNWWTVGTAGSVNLPSIDDRLTRGGPQARTPVAPSVDVNVSSDPRRSWALGADWTHAWNEAGGRGEFPSLTLSVRPSPTLHLSFQPGLSVTHALAQYVGTIQDTVAHAPRYVFATLDQHVVSLVTRIDWTFTPRLSLQLYAQPLVVSGAYSGFKEFLRPRTFDFAVYGRDEGTIARQSDRTYLVARSNGDSLRIGDPNFNFRSLLGNAVVRWEYRPGSTLFFVWQQRRSDVQPIGDFDFQRDYSAMLHRAPENVFAVKATWWVGL